MRAQNFGFVGIRQHIDDIGGDHDVTGEQPALLGLEQRQAVPRMPGRLVNLEPSPAEIDAVTLRQHVSQRRRTKGRAVVLRHKTKILEAFGQNLQVWRPGLGIGVFLIRRPHHRIRQRVPEPASGELERLSDVVAVRVGGEEPQRPVQTSEDLIQGPVNKPPATVNDQHRILPLDHPDIGPYQRAHGFLDQQPQPRPHGFQAEKSVFKGAHDGDERSSLVSLSKSVSAQVSESLSASLPASLPPDSRGWARHYDSFCRWRRPRRA